MEYECNRIGRMMILRDHLKELFELIGIVPQKVTVRALPKLLTLLERLIKDRNLYDYLENLDADCVQAIQEMKKRNLYDWNNRQVIQKHSALQQENQALKQQILQLLQEKEAEQEADEKAPFVASEQPPQNDAQEELQKQNIIWIQEIISLRDSILIRKSWIEENATENVDAMRLVNMQLKDTGRLLERMGVEIIDDSGKFDYNIHVAVGTTETTSELLVDHVAQTVRPGYQYRGEILRLQEVIVYVLAEEGA